MLQPGEVWLGQQANLDNLWPTLHPLLHDKELVMVRGLPSKVREVERSLPARPSGSILFGMAEMAGRGGAAICACYIAVGQTYQNCGVSGIWMLISSTKTSRADIWLC